MNIFRKIERELQLIIKQMKAEGVLPESVIADKIEATPPRDASHGDIATNAAMVVAAQIGKNPKEIAALFAERLTSPSPSWGRAGGEGEPSTNAISSTLRKPPLPNPLPNPLPQGERGYIVKAEVAGPGFINITLAPSIWQESLLDILEQGVAYGDSQIGQGQRVNVEYVSVNPTGPMHVGHARYIYGDALANLLLKAGYGVTKEYYINDAGAQVDKVAESLHLRYLEALGHSPYILENGEYVFPSGLYPGDYLKPPAEVLAKKYGNTLSEGREKWFPIFRQFAVEAMMDLIKTDLASLGIYHEIFASEQAIRDAGKVEEAIGLLDKKGLIYTGVLEAPKGKPVPDDWEARPQTLFRSTQFGDDLDRPIKKSDGSWTYFGPDIAYQYDKIQRGYTKLIMLLGIDHGGYVKRLKAAVNALSDGKVELEVKLCQLVKFMRGGEPLKMSKRAGTFITVREVVDEVGKDVFRFIMLTRKNDVPLDFDFAKVMEQSKDNPVFYVQYAHARAHSVMRRAREEMPEALLLPPLPLAGEGRGGGLSSVDENKAPSLTLPPAGRGDILKRLSHPEELALIRLMCNWPRLVESAALGLEPHRVAFYLQELAAAFHSFWNLGNDELGLRFLIKHDIELTAARIALARGVALVIASGLAVLGVEPVEEMR